MVNGLTQTNLFLTSAALWLIDLAGYYNEEIQVASKLNLIDIDSKDGP